MMNPAERFKATADEIQALCDVAEAAETYRHAVESGREDEGIGLAVTYRSLVQALDQWKARRSINEEYV